MSPVVGDTHSNRAAREPRRPAGGFSLIELVIVIVIMGVIAAIAIGKFSWASRGMDEKSVDADLAQLRQAIELYQGEHGGTYPTLAGLQDQLTKYTDHAGNPSPTRTGSAMYGPYIRKFPARRRNAGAVVVVAAPDPDADWVYDATNGTIDSAAAGAPGN